MWPFKKKPGTIRAQYLKDAGISTDFEDAFRYSKGELKKHLGELESQEKMWNDQLSDLHTQKKVRDRKMERLTDEANNPDITEQAENDPMAQLSELEKQYLQDSKQTREAMASLREVEKTQWLLSNILDGTFSDVLIDSLIPQKRDGVAIGKTCLTVSLMLGALTPNAKTNSVTDLR